MKAPSNKLNELYHFYSKSLYSIYNPEESKQIVALLIEHFFGVSRLELLTNAELRLNESDLLLLHFGVKRLRASEPLQYVTGECFFDGHRFEVNQNVLIPRSETEQLVAICASFLSPGGQTGRIADIGTGSGCIAISLALRFPKLKVDAYDVSQKALDVARNNAARLKAKVEFGHLDILKDKLPVDAGLYRLIVSNPPYVLESEKAMMHANVLNYEPQQALFVSDNDPLLFYEAIADAAKSNLEPGGMLALEINEAKGQQIKSLLQSKGFNDLKIIDDIHGKARFATALQS